MIWGLNPCLTSWPITRSLPATLAAPPMGALDVSEALIQKVAAADVIVVGTPMHSFTVPSVLKAWIDQIVHVGRTMKSTPARKVKRLRDRPVFIGVASGGVFSGDRANQPDFLTPLLSLAFGSIGLKNPAMSLGTSHRVHWSRVGHISEGESLGGD